MKIKQILIYGVTWAGIPILLILCIEAILRLSNVGYNPHYFLHVKDQGQTYCIDNPSFGRRFFPPTLVRAPEKQRFPERKEPDTYRIFILGASAAQGEPAPAFGFSRQLHLQLRERYKNIKCEVINTGITAINSHVVVPIARECSRLSPDVFVVYTGNNEVIGPFGPGTVFSSFSNLWLIRLRIFLSSTRIGQLASAISFSLTNSNGVPTGWGGMKMFLEHKFRFDDPRLDGMYRHYRENLRAICKTARRGGARVVLCTVASNLKDCPPFFSMHRKGYSTDILKDWDSLFQRAVTLQRQANFSEALTEFKKTAEIDSTYAGLQFKIAQCLSALGQHCKAREHYLTARDCDAIRFRADTRLNQIVRDVAEEFRDCAVLLDAENSLAGLSGHSVCGKELFLEHVHFNFNGNYQFARSLLSVLDSLVEKPVAVPTVLSETECRERLAFTSWEELQINQEIYKRLTRPPFVGIDDNQVKALELKGKIEQLIRDVKDSIEIISNGYRHALLLDSTDTYIIGLFGSFLLQQRGYAAEAERIFRKIIKLMPHNEFAHRSLAIALEQQEKFADAIECYREVIKINPLLFDAYVKIADNLIHLSRMDEAQKYLDKVLQINPELPSALQRYAQLLIMKGKAVTDPHIFEKNEIFRMALAVYYNAEGVKLQNNGAIEAALQKFESATTVYPHSVELQVNFGMALIKSGRINDAIEHFKAAVAIDSSSAGPRVHLAGALAQQGRVQDALKQYSAALSLDSTLIPVFNSMGILCINSGDYDQALGLFMRAVHQQPSMMAIHNNIITTCAYMNKKTDAIVLFEQLLKTYPQTAELHYSIGKLFLEQGNVSEARTHLGIAAQLRPELM